MSASTPALSVVIPSYNRCASLKRTLISLYRQEFPLTQVEVIVVLDGGSDDSAGMLAELQTPFELVVLEQPNQGSAVARNHGAAAALGDLLVFLDDDMEVAPSFLAAHADAHGGRDDQVVLGYFTCDMGTGPSYFVDQLRSWWAVMFRRMREPGHRFAYTDLLSGNFSVGKRLFQRSGGFDAALIRHHDYELGYNLLAAGGEFQYVEAAAGIHHERSSLHRMLMGKVAEGKDDVLLGQHHPDLKPILPLSGLLQYQTLVESIAMRLAFRFPALGDRLAQLFEDALGRIERMRRYGTWLHVLSVLTVYWYWRGVAQKLPSLRVVGEFLATGKTPQPAPAINLNLDEGIAAAEARLDRELPASAALFYHGYPIGHIPALAGTERLHGRHLRPLLWHEFRIPLFHALAQPGITGFPGLDERLRELAAETLQTWEEPAWRV